MARVELGLKRNKRRAVTLFLFFTLCLLLFNPLGCNPTYPKERVDKSIINLCKREYKVDVEIKVVGKTIGVYIPIEDLIGINLAINPDKIGKVDDVIMSISRVALSTDAKFNFYVLVAQDPIVPDIELIIIRNVTDVKRFLVTDISQSEYLNRMIIQLKLTPQAEKERVIRELFARTGVDVSEETIEDYFKSGYIDTISDIGYWNGNFFLKDVSMGEFIAKQVEERMRKDFTTDNSLKIFKLNFVDSAYKNGNFNFAFEVNSPDAPADSSKANRSVVLKYIYGVVSKVLHGYGFQDYSYINLSYNGEKVVFTKENLQDIKKRKLKVEDII